MCNCVPWIPLPFSIIKLGNSTLNNSQIPATHFPVIRNNGRLRLFDCRRKATPSRRSGSEGKGYGDLEFEDKGDNELELRRRRSDASLEKISDEELKGEKGSGKNGDELVKMESRRRQMMKRSNMVAKQVWLVLVVEVRPSLLAGESERFLLQDINKVGDVVLVEDEGVMEYDFKRIRLETLVGYKIVTPGHRNIGKVSTYALLVEDVLEVMADTVVVHEAAASRMQRLTKGFLDAHSAGISIDEHTEYADDEGPARFGDGRRTQRGFSGQKSRSKMREADDLGLPMDYL